jgi:hypothetical protein
VARPMDLCNPDDRDPSRGGSSKEPLLALEFLCRQNVRFK